MGRIRNSLKNLSILRAKKIKSIEKIIAKRVYFNEFSYSVCGKKYCFFLDFS